MANVFSSAPPEEDEDATPGLRVAGALTGGGEDAPEEDAPEATQPQGKVDDSGQSYLTPAGADDDETGPPSTSAEDVPVSADTKAYMQPVVPPTLAKPADYADHSADTAAMTAQKVAEAKENVKPSIGRKILAAFGAAATGFGSGAEAGGRVGQQILAGPRTNAEARWATQEAPLQAKLSADAAADAATHNANTNTEQSNRLAETNYSNQIRGQQDAARAENYSAQAAARNEQVNGDGWKQDTANPLGSYTATTIGGKTIHSATAPASVQNTADYRIADAEAKGHPFTTEQQQILRGGGKLTFHPPANPRQPSAEEISLGQARAAFIKENGRPPQTLDEQNRVTQAAKGTLDKTAAGAIGADAAIAKSMQDKDVFAKQWERIEPEDATGTNPEGDYQNAADPSKKMSAAEFNSRLDKFRTDLNNDPVMRKSGTMVDPQGNTVTNRFSRNPTTAPADWSTTMAVPNPAGLRERGNIKINDRPVVPNGRDSSTILSMSIGTDKGEVLIPMVSDGADGKPPHIMSDPEARAYYAKTGQHLGIFDTPAHATQYANALHAQQAALGQSNGRTSAAQPQSPAAAPAPSGMKVSLSQARTLLINKDKSDAQIRADIMAHGHQVAP